jgi:hypothetical protein
LILDDIDPGRDTEMPTWAEITYTILFVAGLPGILFGTNPIWVRGSALCMLMALLILKTYGDKPTTDVRKVKR